MPLLLHHTTRTRPQARPKLGMCVSGMVRSALSNDWGDPTEHICESICIPLPLVTYSRSSELNMRALVSQPKAGTHASVMSVTEIIPRKIEIEDRKPHSPTPRSKEVRPNRQCIESIESQARLLGDRNFDRDCRRPGWGLPHTLRLVWFGWLVRLHM